MLAEGRRRGESAASLSFQTQAMLYQTRLRPHVLPHTVLTRSPMYLVAMLLLHKADFRHMVDVI